MKSPSQNCHAERDGILQTKEKFLSMLRECPGYPFNEYEDGAFFRYVYEEYPFVDIISELDKKIAWWKEHPGALTGGRKFYREQLGDWFQLENNYRKEERKCSNQ